MRGKAEKSIGAGGVGQRMLRDSLGAAPALVPGTPPCRLRQDMAHLHARIGADRGTIQKGEKMLFLPVNIPLWILFSSLFWSLLKQQPLVTCGSAAEGRAECKRLIYFLLVLLIHGSPWLLLTTGNQLEAFQYF